MKTIAALAAFLATATVANAVTVTGSAIGNWSDFEGTYGYWPGGSDVGNGQTSSAEVSWGYSFRFFCRSCTSYNNMWGFNGVGSDNNDQWEATSGSVFKFGDFQFRNGTTIWSNFEGATLSVDLNINGPETITRSFNLDFDLVNVPDNFGNPVANGDIARLVGTVEDQYFSIGNIEYTLEFAGFSQDGGQNLASELLSPEGYITTAGLYGKITANEILPVPLPGAGSMAIVGIVAVGLIKRRRKLGDLT